ncbi:tripartite tricarboxylate transporter substrate-binding protein [Acidovorax sp. Be4]|uniref:Tripartite tricarboxylate transporter substrate-binding protein n=1 Tax=Acidovorax bellezanensis TaxID=2976702 RepID=A0ABT2PJQ6_9BURK|nr:tripartite tricarboxylate transporter substrate-binding protein [Acidovorax sp. Be4]MCT9810717.1 tripartite tricarboxylate transporter substrate-binding protein [Acidovorax sp. Be4]
MAAVALPAMLAAPAQAQAPDVTRIVVGFAPGGALDVLARVLAEKLRVSLGGTVLVENKAGGSARLALVAVKNAAPDGKTILMSSPSPVSIFPLTYSKLGYDPDKDLIPLAHLAEVRVVASTGMKQPYKTIGEYVNWVKGKPADQGVGLVTMGSPIHFGLLSMGKTTGIPLTPVPYKGSAPILTDLVGGALPLSIDTIGGQMELYRSGKIRFLGVSGAQRSAFFPEVPTLKEAGIPGFEVASSWFGAFLPAGTPPATVARLEKAFIDAAKSPDVRAKMETLAMEMTGQPGAMLRKTIQKERAHWKPIAEASGFKGD